jgi:tRNA dimethylallyltransferase
MIRALEVTLTLGRPFSEVGHERGTPLPSLRLVLSMPRQEIYRRVDARVDAMIAAGWLDEVRGLLTRGYDATLPSISSHGYREMVAVVKGRMSLEEAAQKTTWAIHAYVRRQTSWLKSQPGYHWIEAGPGALDAASSLVEPFLSRR